MSNNKSEEMYLETIYTIEKEKGHAHVVDIAAKLDVKKPSVIKAMTILKLKGYIKQKAYCPITLTDNGRQAAEEVYQKHVLIKSYLVKTLGVSESLAEENACEIEHVLSDELVFAIKKFIE